jgi:hypothetical protein
MNCVSLVKMAFPKGLGKDQCALCGELQRHGREETFVLWVVNECPVEESLHLPQTAPRSYKQLLVETLVCEALSQCLSITLCPQNQAA